MQVRIAELKDKIFILLEKTAMSDKKVNDQVTLLPHCPPRPLMSR